MEFDSRRYCVFSTTELHLIDFTQVLETSAETVRLSLDGSFTFVKWNDQHPDCINHLTTIQGIYTHDEILTLLSGPGWTASLNEEQV